eukprot:m.223608 g.223608  ORF g.223608 m.223608 type:complete len:300 (+) comp10826_c1_seq8:66-965(+)
MVLGKSVYSPSPEPEPEPESPEAPPQAKSEERPLAKSMPPQSPASHPASNPTPSARSAPSSPRSAEAEKPEQSVKAAVVAAAAAAAKPSAVAARALATSGYRGIFTPDGRDARSVAAAAHVPASSLGAGLGSSPALTTTAVPSTTTSSAAPPVPSSSPSAETGYPGTAYSGGLTSASGTPVHTRLSFRSPLLSTPGSGAKVEGGLGAAGAGLALGGGEGVQAEFLRNMLESVMQDAMLRFHSDMRNLHLETLRMFEMQKVHRYPMAAARNSDNLSSLHVDLPVACCACATLPCSRRCRH